MNNTPHYVINTERALLGTILANNQAYHEVANLLPEHFYLPLHQRTWQAIVNRIEAGQIADAVTLQAEFGENRGAMDITADYLAELLTCMATFTSVPECAEDIYNCWVRREDAKSRARSGAGAHVIARRSPGRVPFSVSSEILDTLGDVAYSCDGEEFEHFELRVLPHLYRYTEAELWILAGKLAGRRCTAEATIVAEYAVATACANGVNPDVVKWWAERNRRKNSASRRVAPSVDIDPDLPF